MASYFHYLLVERLIYRNSHKPIGENCWNSDACKLYSILFAREINLYLTRLSLFPNIKSLSYWLSLVPSIMVFQPSYEQSNYYSEISWASGSLKSQVTQLSVQKLVIGVFPYLGWVNRNMFPCNGHVIPQYTMIKTLCCVTSGIQLNLLHLGVAVHMVRESKLRMDYVISVCTCVFLVIRHLFYVNLLSLAQICTNYAFCAIERSR